MCVCGSPGMCSVRIETLLMRASNIASLSVAGSSSLLLVHLTDLNISPHDQEC